MQGVEFFHRLFSKKEYAGSSEVWLPGKHGIDRDCGTTLPAQKASFRRHKETSFRNAAKTRISKNAARRIRSTATREMIPLATTGSESPPVLDASPNNDD